MLIDLSITNFKSIKDRVTFTMLPSGRIKNSEHCESLYFNDNYKISLIKSSLIYGGNASGKSNFLMAFAALIFLVKNSSDFKLDQNIAPYEPYKLDINSKESPIIFEIDFLSNNLTRYKYKIEFSSNEFVNEALYFYPHGQKAKLFVREKGKKISYGDYFKGTKKIEVLPNQLILSKAGKDPIESLQEPYRFFSRHIYCHIIHDTEYDEVLIHSFSKIIANKDNSNLRENINKLLCASDSGIKAINIKEVKEDDFRFPDDLTDKEKKEIVEKYKFRIKTEHDLYSNNDKIGTEFFDLFEESTGTIKLLALGGLILEALEDGTTIVIDELDKSLHPLLTRMLINIFNSNTNNPNNAQLIFATHDISLIDQSLLRRDQIWFTEKDEYGKTGLYPLSDFTGISKVRTLDNWYMNGRFGGIPNLKRYILNLEFSSEKN